MYPNTRLYSQFLHSLETFIGELTRFVPICRGYLEFSIGFTLSKTKIETIEGAPRFLFKNRAPFGSLYNRVDPRWQKLLNVGECFRRGCSPDERQAKMERGGGGGRWARACIIIWPVWIFISTALTRSACKKLQAFLSTRYRALLIPPLLTVFYDVNLGASSVILFDFSNLLPPRPRRLFAK